MYRRLGPRHCHRPPEANRSRIGSLSQQSGSRAQTPSGYSSHSLARDRAPVAAPRSAPSDCCPRLRFRATRRRRSRPLRRPRPPARSARRGCRARVNRSLPGQSFRCHQAGTGRRAGRGKSAINRSSNPKWITAWSSASEIYCCWSFASSRASLQRSDNSVKCSFMQAWIRPPPG